MDEIRRMDYARYIVSMYQSRAKSENWTSWLIDHPYGAKLLSEAAELANG